MNTLFLRTSPGGSSARPFLFFVGSFALIWAAMRFLPFFDSAFAVMGLIVYFALVYKYPAMWLMVVIFFSFEALSMLRMQDSFTLPGALKLRDLFYLSPLVMMLPIGFSRKRAFQRILDDPVAKIFLFLISNYLVATIISGFVYGGDLLVGIRQSRDYILIFFIYFYLIYYIDSPRRYRLLERTTMLFGVFAAFVMLFTTFVDRELLAFANAAQKTYAADAGGVIVTKIYYQSLILVYPLYFLMLYKLIRQPTLSRGIATILLFVAIIAASSRGILFSMFLASFIIIFKYMRETRASTGLQRLSKALLFIAMLFGMAMQSQIFGEFFLKYNVVGQTGIREISRFEGNYANRMESVWSGIETAVLFNPLNGSGHTIPGSEVELYAQKTQWRGSIGGETSYGPIFGKMGLIGAVLYFLLFSQIFKMCRGKALFAPYRFALFGLSLIVLAIGFLGQILLDSYGLITLSIYIFLTRYSDVYREKKEAQSPARI